MTDPSAQAAAVGERYDAIAPAYVRYWSPVIRPIAEHAVARLPIHGASVVLDAGGGTGAVVPALRGRAPGALVVCADVSVGMLRHVPRRDAAPVATDVHRLPLADGTVDGALCAFVLQHVPDPTLPIRELARVVRPGGVLGTVTWAAGEQDSGAAKTWEEAWRREGIEDAPPATVATHELMDEPAKVVARVEDAGFEVVECRVAAFEHRWALEDFVGLRTSYGVHRARLDALEPARRAAFLDEVRARLAALPPDGFVYRPAVVVCVARRP